MDKKRKVAVAIDLLLVALVVSAVVVYAVTILSQNVPDTVVGPKPTFAVNCATVGLETVPTPGNGTVEYGCPSNTASPTAITVSGGTVTETPTFTVSVTSGTVTLYVGNPGGCGTAQSRILITSGTALQLGPQGYNYCIVYQNISASAGGTIHIGTVTWSG